MIAGLPVASWLLLLAAVGLGLALELAYLRAHRGEPGAGAPDDDDPAEALLR